MTGECLQDHWTYDFSSTHLQDFQKFLVSHAMFLIKTCKPPEMFTLHDN